MFRNINCKRIWVVIYDIIIPNLILLNFKYICDSRQEMYNLGGVNNVLCVKNKIVVACINNYSGWFKNFVSAKVPDHVLHFGRFRRGKVSNIASGHNLSYPICGGCIFITKSSDFGEVRWAFRSRAHPRRGPKSFWYSAILLGLHFANVPFSVCSSAKWRVFCVFLTETIARPNTTFPNFLAAHLNPGAARARRLSII